MCTLSTRQPDLRPLQCLSDCFQIERVDNIMCIQHAWVLYTVIVVIKNLTLVYNQNKYTSFSQINEYSHLLNMLEINSFLFLKFLSKIIIIQ